MASDFFVLQEKMRALRSALDRVGPQVERSLNHALDISWIHHDSALEGDVFEADEIVAAIEGRPPVPGSTEQISRQIRTLKTSLEAMRREVRHTDCESALLLLKKLHTLVSLDPARAGRYRRTSPGHRVFFHEIAKPSRISYLLRKLFSWVESEDARRMHPIRVAGEIHYRLITIAPFEESSGPVSRLFTHHFLLAHGYLPAIIHAKDRQKYYEAFIPPVADDLTELMAASLANSIDSSLRIVQRRSAVLQSCGVPVTAA